MITKRVAMRHSVAVFGVMWAVASTAAAQEQGRGSVRHSGANYAVQVDNRNPLPNGLDRTGTQSTAGAANNRNAIDRTRQDNRNQLGDGLDATGTQSTAGAADNRNHLPDGLDPVGRQSVPGAADNRNQISEQRVDNRTDFRGDEMYELDTSRGAAPRNHHYVRPGTRVPALPRSYVPLNVGGSTFYFCKGVYYQANGGGYHVVAAPAGAEIMMLPVGAVVIAVDDPPYYYYFYYGSFYVWHQDRATYTVEGNPVGATVTQLPDGYTTTVVGGVKYYEFGGIRYRPFNKHGTVVYTVVE